MLLVGSLTIHAWKDKLRLMSLMGYVIFLGIAYLCSHSRKRVSVCHAKEHYPPYVSTPRAPRFEDLGDTSPLASLRRRCFQYRYQGRQLGQICFVSGARNMVSQRLTTLPAASVCRWHIHMQIWYGGTGSGGAAVPPFFTNLVSNVLRLSFPHDDPSYICV